VKVVHVALALVAGVQHILTVKQICLKPQKIGVDAVLRAKTTA